MRIALSKNLQQIYYPKKKITDQSKIRDVLIHIGKETGNETLEQYAVEFEKQHFHVIQDLIGYPEWFEEVQVPFMVRKKIKSKFPSASTERRSTDRKNTGSSKSTIKKNMDGKTSAPKKKVSTKSMDINVKRSNLSSKPALSIRENTAQLRISTPAWPSPISKCGQTPPPDLFPLSTPPAEPPSDDSSTDEEDWSLPPAVTKDPDDPTPPFIPDDNDLPPPPLPPPYDP